MSNRLGPHVRSLLQTESDKDRRLLLVGVIASAVLFLVTAVVSYEFYYPDEYFQTIEFASYKLGITPRADLAWEFGAQIRPWIQPALYFAIAKVAGTVGVHNPFTLAFLFRLSSAVAAWCAVTLLMIASFVFFRDRSRTRAVVLMLAFLCFIPYIAVRTSSGSLSGSLLMIATALLIIRFGSPTEHGVVVTRWSPFVCGLLLGFAFDVRYQSGIVIVGIYIWMIFFAARKSKLLRWLLYATLGVLAAIAVGTVIDRWGYGRWTFTPYNYLSANIFKGIASHYGTEPVWGYFTEATTNTFGFGLLLLIAMVVSWFRYPKSITTWITLPYFVIHSLIPHKELRFLFPIALLMPYLIVLAIAPKEGGKAPVTSALWAFRRHPVAKVAYLLNFVALAVNIFWGGSQPEVQMQRFLYGKLPHGGTAYVLAGANPYHFYTPRVGFFRPPNLHVVEVKNISALKSDIADSPNPAIVISSNRALAGALGSDKTILLFRTNEALWIRIKHRLRSSYQMRFYYAYEVKRPLT